MWTPVASDRPAVHPVHAWPGVLPAPVDGLIVIRIDTSSIRDLARQQIRLASRQLLCQLWGVPLAAIGLEAKAGAGQAPRITLHAGVALDVAASNIGISISHEPGVALAAIHLHGAVGVDLMRMQDVPDWKMVARDYLGAGTAAALAGMSPERRTRAFARAWTAQEASLKCRSLPLGEWVVPTLPAPCHSFELALPDDLVGTLAIPAWVRHVQVSPMNDSG